MTPDKQTIICHRAGTHLVAKEAYDAELLDAYACNTDLEVTVKQPKRSNEHLRLYWKVLHIVCQNCDGFPKAEDLHKALKMALGYVDRQRRLDGSIVEIPQSIGFRAMDQSEFNTYFDRAMETISTHVLPGVDPLALLREAEEI